MNNILEIVVKAKGVKYKGQIENMDIDMLEGNIILSFSFICDSIGTLYLVEEIVIGKKKIRDLRDNFVYEINVYEDGCKGYITTNICLNCFIQEDKETEIEKLKERIEDLEQEVLDLEDLHTLAVRLKGVTWNENNEYIRRMIIETVTRGKR